MKITDCPSMKECYHASFAGQTNCKITEKTKEKKDFSRLKKEKNFEPQGFYGTKENYFKRFIRLTKNIIAGEITLPNYEEKWMLFNNQGHIITLKEEKEITIKIRKPEEPLDIFTLSIIGYDFFTLEKMNQPQKLLLRKRDEKIRKITFIEPITSHLAWLKNEITKNYELKNIDTNKTITKAKTYPITKIINNKYLFILKEEEGKVNSELLDYKSSPTPELVKRARIDINFQELLKIEKAKEKDEKNTQKQRKL